MLEKKKDILVCFLYAMICIYSIKKAEVKKLLTENKSFSPLAYDCPDNEDTN